MTVHKQGYSSIQRGLLLGLLTLLFAIVIWFTHSWSAQVAYEQLGQKNMNEIFRFSAGLRAILQKYKPVPHQLSINPELSDFLGDKSNPEKIDKINRYLTTINDINLSSDIYILDAIGNTVAASNWDSDISFIGNNFSFRPYFKEAMQGKNARYYALGKTSKRRGYYFSSPISDDDDILGVVVLKISLTDIEENWVSPWESNNIELIVADSDGVIFISTQAEWRLKSLAEISPERLTVLKESKRYGDLNPSPINITKHQRPPGSRQNNNAHNATLLTIENNPGQTVQYLSQSIDMPFAGWRIFGLSRVADVQKQVQNALFVASSVYFLIVLIILFFSERIRNEKSLEKARDSLELRVKKRTADLEQSNCRLIDEIDERRKTESALKQTQEELIQAAKMAVLGQISAGINHELNQPLTAIRSYAQNTQQFLQRGNIETANSNLTEIIALSDHMASIISQLKIFSSKRAESVSPVNVLTCLNDAIKIISVQIKREGVDIRIRSDNVQIQVLGDLVRLEQVFVNLISNACQAMSHCSQKTIMIHVSADTENVTIRFEDTGPGIADEHLKQIFEPFFTTKNISQGLGLGLSISKRIIEAMHGTMSATNSTGGGAVFSMTLPKVASGAGDKRQE